MFFKVSSMEESTTVPGFLFGEDLLIGEPVTSIDEAEEPLRTARFILFSNDLVGIEDSRSNTLDLLAVDEVAIALLLLVVLVFVKDAVGDVADAGEDIAAEL